MPITPHGRRTPLTRDRAERGRALSIDEVATRRLTFLASCERARARAYAAAGDTEAAQAANDNATQAERIAQLIKEGR
jgi:hypothetical protein